MVEVCGEAGTESLFVFLRGIHLQHLHSFQSRLILLLGMKCHGIPIQVLGMLTQVLKERTGFSSRGLERFVEQRASGRELGLLRALWRIRRKKLSKTKQATN